MDISRVQDDEVGDGTTSVTVLASELLKEAEKLIAAKIHPQTIIDGWRKAVTVAREALTSVARDHGYNQEKKKKKKKEKKKKKMRRRGGGRRRNGRRRRNRRADNLPGTRVGADKEESQNT